MEIALVCLKTANSGEDASGLYSRPELPGLVWSTPYLVHSPDNCFVVERDGEVVGYIVTTPDTRAFEAWQRDFWWPEVCKRLSHFEVKAPNDQDFLDTLERVQAPAPNYADDFPAHLHINLLPEAQGGGKGRKLIETASDRLLKLGATKLHLGVSFTNQKAIGFYQAMGFEEVTRDGALILGKSL
ncbi:MAG: GNAT family N-acetyltransferase [Maritalea sp.]